MDLANFRELTSKYIDKCNAVKTLHYSEEINQCEGDQCKLYKLVNKLIDGEERIIYPECTNDQNLSEEFSKLFH